MVRSLEVWIGPSWIARRAALRASSSLFTVGLSVPLPLSVDTGRDESKFDEGKTFLCLEGSRPMRRGFFGLREDSARGPGPVNVGINRATATPRVRMEEGTTFLFCCCGK